MVGHVNDGAFDHSDIAIEYAIQGAAGDLLVLTFPGSNLWILPEDKSPKGL